MDDVDERGVLKGPLRLGTSSKARTGSRDDREGTACCCSALFVFSFVSAKEGDTGC